MKRQIGIWVDSQVWAAYRDLCRAEKVRPAEPVEEFVRFVVRRGSASTVMNVLRGVEESRSEGFEAYARVLLNWRLNEKYWIHISNEDDAPTEPMLLHALKDIRDPKLRQEIEDALKIGPEKKKIRRIQESLRNEKPKRRGQRF